MAVHGWGLCLLPIAIGASAARLRVEAVVVVVVASVILFVVPWPVVVLSSALPVVWLLVRLGSSRHVSWAAVVSGPVSVSAVVCVRTSALAVSGVVRALCERRRRCRAGAEVASWRAVSGSLVR